MVLPRLIVDTLIRKKVALHATELDRFTIRVARTVEEYEDAFRLVQVGYKFAGIVDIDAPNMRIAEQHVLSEAIVLNAYEGNQCVGTMSATLDSPAGLPLDQDYPDEMAALRKDGARVVEIGSFAVVRRCWSTGVAQLLSMAATRAAFRWLEGTCVVIGVNPKVWPMYRAIWSFKTLGETRQHADLIAPTLGLVAQREEVLRNSRRLFPRRMQSGLRVVDHLCDGPPLPCMAGADQAPRDPMARPVFQELFLKRSERIAELKDRTMAYLRQRRTDDTLNLAQNRSGSASRARRLHLHLAG